VRVSVCQSMAELCLRSQSIPRIMSLVHGVTFREIGSSWLAVQSLTKV
jgi:hypothetical protein